MIEQKCVICEHNFSFHRTKRTCSIECGRKLQGKNISGESHFNFKTGIATNREYECQICNKKFYSKKGYETRIPKYCSRQCAGKSLKIEKPIRKCLECKNEFISKYNRKNQKYCSIKCSAIAIGRTSRGKKGNFCGSESNFWRGGICNENDKIRKSAEYRNWRKLVFERDNYTCQICNKRGGKLHADHIKLFALYPELRLDLSNGRTLCIECHKKTDTYGLKAIKIIKEVQSKQLFIKVDRLSEYHRLINSLYESKLKFDIVRMELE